MIRQYGLLTTLKKIVNWIVLVGPLIYLWIVWDTIPDTVPTHFNALGEADAWGYKDSIFILVFVSFMIFAILSVVERFPALWNTGVKITEENRERIYSILRDMIITTKLLVSCLFMYQILNVIYVDRLPSLILTMVSVSVVGSLVYYIIKLFKNE